MRILKFKVNETDHQYLDVHKNAKLLSIQSLNNILYAWVKVESDCYLNIMESEKKELKIFGTSQEITNVTNYSYFATVQCGKFVWHIYERVF